MLPKGTPTHTQDIKGKTICLGDIVGYDYPESKSRFEVVFEQNAFRKKYKMWSKDLPKPMLEFGIQAEIMRLLIKKPYKA